MTEQEKVPAIRFAGFTDPWEQRKSWASGSWSSNERIIVNGYLFFMSIPNMI